MSLSLYFWLFQWDFCRQGKQGYKIKGKKRKGEDNSSCFCFVLFFFPLKLLCFSYFFFLFWASTRSRRKFEETADPSYSFLSCLLHHHQSLLLEFLYKFTKGRPFLLFALLVADCLERKRGFSTGPSIDSTSASAMTSLCRCSSPVHLIIGCYCW